MASASTSSSPATTDETQPQNQESDQQQVMKECVHRTKTIQFFGRTTPIILQNDNGPCPLLAICNVLLLRNNLNLHPDIPEVSQKELLSLVVERLLDSNSNVNNKDAGYIKNQQQNIADAMNLLPKLTTGIDVNVKFRRIDDFEFTTECAIFDLLDIPLYHGWIIDPQDNETANAIGSKSYNAITAQLVELDTQNMERTDNNSPEGCVDFAAATTATLGVPCPTLSTTRSFDDSPSSDSDSPKVRKGDVEEEAELLAALKLSETEFPSSSLGAALVIADERTNTENHVHVGSVDTREGQNGVGNHNLQYPEISLSDKCNADDAQTCFKSISKEEINSSSKIDGGDHDVVQSSSLNYEEFLIINDAVKTSRIEAMDVEKSDAIAALPTDCAISISPVENSALGENTELQSTSTSSAPEVVDHLYGYDTTEVSSLSLPNADSESSSGRIQPGDVTSSLDGSEPIYEGEECILDSGTKVQEKGEPEYEGEAILAEQADKRTLDTCNARSKDGITPQEGDLIRNFLKNNASQLTVYGLFCLQEGLKERELCVFFRNNHFSTMFKYNGELYLLATDQGYLNQPDLVWEKLDVVNGDTLFMTSNFKEFKADGPSSGAWDERNAMANTADFISSIDSAGHPGSDINSDLQLAIALQQQEFEQQPQRQNAQQPSVSGGSRLVTGPQVGTSRGRYPVPQKPEPKSKDKCVVM